MLPRSCRLTFAREIPLQRSPGYHCPPGEILVSTKSWYIHHPAERAAAHRYWAILVLTLHNIIHNVLNFKLFIQYATVQKFRVCIFFFKDVPYAHQCCIYLCSGKTEFSVPKSFWNVDLMLKKHILSVSMLNMVVLLNIFVETYIFPMILWIESLKNNIV